MNIIIVDDEPAALELLTYEIQNLIDPIQLKTFLSPKLAFEYIKENRVDLAFLDIEMPEMSGIVLG